MTMQPPLPEDPTRPLDVPPPVEVPPPLEVAASLDVPPPLGIAAPAPAAVPRIRWAGIVWGSFFALLAATGLWTLAEASRRAVIHDWLLTLTPGSINPGVIVGFSVLAVGLLLLIAGGVALLRRAQLRATIER